MDSGGCSGKPQSWWSRECGVREVLVLSLPLVISMVSWTVMNFIDRMYLLWYSLPAMGAAMPAGMLYFALVCFPMGVASYVNAFVAQYHGAGRPERIGAVVVHAMRFGMLAAPLYLLFIPLAGMMFRAAGHEAEIASLEAAYFRILMFGAGGTVIATAQSTFFTGRGQTRAVMVVDVTAAVVNIVLDYLWIFGKFGFPEMGIEGAAWATVAAQWWKVGYYRLLMHNAELRSQYGIRMWSPIDWALARRIMRYGGPSGLQMTVDVIGITLFVMLVGRLGSHAMVATSLAFNVNSVAFVPIYGLGIAVTTMVGQQIGRASPHLASRATWTSYWIAMIYSGIMAALYFFTPDLFLIGHASGVDPDEFEKLRATVVVLLRFVAAYALLDATAVVFVSAIKGAGDTRFIMYVTLVTAPLPLVFGIWGVSWMGWGLLWCWVVLTAWICTLGMIYLARFLQGKWKSMSVIEGDVAPDEDAETDSAVEAVAM